MLRLGFFPCYDGKKPKEVRSLMSVKYVFLFQANFAVSLRTFPVSLSTLKKKEQFIPKVRNTIKSRKFYSTATIISVPLSCTIHYSICCGTAKRTSLSSITSRCCTLQCSQLLLKYFITQLIQPDELLISKQLINLILLISLLLNIDCLEKHSRYKRFQKSFSRH